MMNYSRFREIVEAYGTAPERWPEADRLDALAFLQADAGARELISDLGEVDAALDAYEVNVNPYLASRIMSALPGQHWVDRCVAWLLPGVDQLTTYFWRPVLVASLPLVAGVWLGSSVTLTDTSFSWEDELTLISLDDSIAEMTLD